MFQARRRAVLGVAVALVGASAAATSGAAVAGGAVAGGAAADVAARIDSLLTRYHDLGMLNGLALVTRRGEVLLQRGYGFANLEQRVPNAPDTRMWLGSVTKVFTATMVMRLADQGQIALGDRVSSLLPWYRQDTGDRITVRQLLNHTSGLPDYMHLPGIGREGFRREVGDGVIDIRAFAQKWCSADLQWEPGSQWGYSNSGYVLLGAIVERVTGQAYEQALHTLILDPLDMVDTGDLAMRPRAVVERLATGYEKQGDETVTRRPWNVSTAYGAGGMYSSLADLMRFDQALERDDFLSATARSAMFEEGIGHWGCGWEVRELPIGPGRASRKLIDHEGFIFWTITQVWRIPADGVFVVLSNNTGDAPVRAMFEGIADLLYGREPAWPKPSAARAVRGLAFTEGAEAALAKYRQLQAQQPDDYEFEERGLNALGYSLLQAAKPEAAVAVFRFMVETWPQSANAWDSYGEGLAGAGLKGEAIEAFAKSLQLNPSNRNAADWLQRLRAP